MEAAAFVPALFLCFSQVRKGELKVKVYEQKEKLRKFQLLQKYKETVRMRLRTRALSFSRLCI